MASQKCVVCGLVDARALVITALSSGERVVVCATHELLHTQSGTVAPSVDALRKLVGERRRAGQRRERFPGDELGAALIAAFAGERRAGGDRRR